MITRGIYVSPDNVIANKNRKSKSMSNWDNYPPGAAHDPSAPYNQELEDRYVRTVSVSISFDCDVDLPCSSTEEDIKEAISNKVWDMIKNNKELKQLEDFGIDEVEVINE